MVNQDSPTPPDPSVNFTSRSGLVNAGARDPDPLAHPVDRSVEHRRRARARGDDLDRLEGAGQRLGRSPPGSRIRQDPGGDGKRDLPAAKPDPSLHQPAEPGAVCRNPAAARSGARHADHARGDRSDAGGLGEGPRAGDREIPRRLRRGARHPGDDRQDLRGAGADARARDGRPLRHHRRRHRPARRADRAFARQVARGLHLDAGGGERLLPLARLGIGRRGEALDRHDREDHPGDARSRRERPAAACPAAARPARDGACARD